MIQRKADDFAQTHGLPLPPIPAATETEARRLARLFDDVYYIVFEQKVHPPAEHKTLGMVAPGLYKLMSLKDTRKQTALHEAVWCVNGAGETKLLVSLERFDYRLRAYRETESALAHVMQVAYMQIPYTPPKKRTSYE